MFPLLNQDSILDPNALGNTSEYIAAGGDPNSAVEILSDAYRGGPVMSSLLVEWLLELGDASPSRFHDTQIML